MSTNPIRARWQAFFVTAAVASIFLNAQGSSRAELRLDARERVKGADGGWAISQKELRWDPKKTAIVICDMWDQHWCQGATRRVAEMAPRMNEVVKEARRRGVFIIHAPSSTMEFYKDTPQRRRAQAAPPVKPKVPLKGWCHLDPEREAPLPIDDSDGGCDDLPQCAGGSPWKRQIATIEIGPEDAITDSAEAYYLMEERGIENLIVMGVHANMCVLGRPFSIRQMVNQGKNVVLMRDFTDSMYNSRKRPFVSHFRGTELVVEHIEKFWCPSITSTAFLGGEPFRFSEDKPLRVAFVIGEKEYDTARTLPEFARAHLEPRGLDCQFIHADGADGNAFPGIEAVQDADLVVLSVRRRSLPKPQMEIIRKYLAAGKPLVAIRTASHAFDAAPPDANHTRWAEFDSEVLGADYENHYNNKPPKDPPTIIRVARNAGEHPVLTGIERNEFPVTSHLYKNRNVAPTVTVLLEGMVHGGELVEPVAWVNERDKQRIFYTSLGSPDDFGLPEFQRLLLNGILWATEQPVPPADPLQGFVIPDEFELERVLAEPTVRQPVSISFDERGRLWVVQYLQYPHPAGLKMLSRDQYWRAVYDQVPQPPPNHVRGKDKITIHEDADGDGQYETHKTFVDGLNITTAVAHGHGGVWVLNPPYLLFYPDRDRNDVPDADPEVRLAGFGLEDTHAVVNSLCWGPDGWLYAAQGSTVTARVVRPGLDSSPKISMGQLIWRYHPVTQEYEVFAEGGGNAFGVEIDSMGQIFSGHNGGNTRGFHYVQGGYLQKGFTKHGPLSNPYAFGFFPAMKHHDVERFTHTFVIYEGGAFSDEYAGKLFGVEPLQGRVVISDIQKDGSTFKTTDLGYAIRSKDSRFKPVDIEVGPDGAIYIADWHDKQVNHFRNHEGQIDPISGRVYRLKKKGTSPVRLGDLAAAAPEDWVRLLTHSNKWQRQTALRLLGNATPERVVPKLEELLWSGKRPGALEAFWALNLLGQFDDALALETLRHDLPEVRRWSVRLLGDKGSISSTLAGALVELALREQDVRTRSQLASSARRFPASESLRIVRALAERDEDVTDPHIPLLLWWAIESKTEHDRAQVIGFFSERELWMRPVVREHLLPRVMRRFAATGTQKDLRVCAKLLEMAGTPDDAAILLKGLEEAFRGRNMPSFPPELIAAMAEKGGGTFAVRLQQRDPGAVAEALKILSSEGEEEQKLSVLGMVSDLGDPGMLPALLKLALNAHSSDVQAAAIHALRAFDSPEIADALIASFDRFQSVPAKAAGLLLVSREGWAGQLLAAVEQGAVPKEKIPLEAVRQLSLHGNEDLVRKRDLIWGKSLGSDKSFADAEIARLASVIHSGTGDPYKGKVLYGMACGACHVLFGLGGQIGPDLSAYQRSDLDAMLLSVVNPSAEIREGYENFQVKAKDARVMSGFLVDQNEHLVVLRGLDGATMTLERAEIESMRATGVSLMPEGLLNGFDDQQLRDLFAYLRSTQPLNN